MGERSGGSRAGRAGGATISLVARVATKIAIQSMNENGWHDTIISQLADCKRTKIGGVGTPPPPKQKRRKAMMEIKEQTPSTTATEQNIQNIIARAALPDGYMANGKMVDEEGVMLPEYLEKYPQALAEALKPLSAASFQRAFLSKAREANKKKVPYSSKKNCAQGMVVQAIKLVNRKKDPAPCVLQDMIRAATATVVDDASFGNLYLHLDAVYTYMLME